VTEPRPARPPLATIICIYEIVIVAFAVASHFFARYLIFNSANTARHYHSYPIQSNPIITLQSVLGWLSYALAITAAVALWQMHRSAFVLFLTRFALGVALTVSRLPRFMQLVVRTQALRPPENGALAVLKFALWIAWAVSAALVALNTLFAWYAYKITSQQDQPSLSEPAPGP
jgi:hypothetical protein